MKVLVSLSFLVAMTLAEPPSYRQQSQADRTYYFAKQQEESQADAPYQASGWKPNGPAFELPQKQEVQPENQYATPAPPVNSYGVPAIQPQRQYGAPAQPERQYGAPAQPQRQYGAPAQPQRQYGAPAQPQRQYGAPAQPERQYGVPAQPQRQYGAPAKQSLPRPQPERQYGAPAETQRQFEQPQNQYGAPAFPEQQYGAPQSATTDPSTPDYDEATIPTGTESQAEPVDSVNELEEEGDVDEQQRQTGEYYIALPDGRLQRVQYMSSQDIAAMKYFAQIQAENVEPLRGAVYAYQPLRKLEFAPARLQVAVNEPAATPVVQIRESSGRNQKITAKAPAKLEVQPLAAELPAPIVAPAYNSYSANYQVPEKRFLVTF
ncbi:pro-resilin [Diachasma alloeum]|uniref:pro-resilin n=1 Tax=Diachasma alloeum TaxID=454923 RepID=UPI0007382BFC|nr:pro-resilin [Diachasma alloeum]